MQAASVEADMNAGQDGIYYAVQEEQLSVSGVQMNVA
jgi:hypothetical protein